MTTKQKAIAAIIAAAAAGGGMVAPDTVRETLRATCKAPEQRIERALPGGLVEKKLTVQQAVNILGQHCEPNNAMLIDRVEITVTGPGR